MLIPVPQPGEYTVALCTDDEKYGGFGQIAHMTYPTKDFEGVHYVELYLPARTAVVLKEHVILPEDVKEEAPKRKGGRSKKTAEAPAGVKAEPVTEVASKKKPGRPKKTAEAPVEVKAEPVAEEAPKRKPGRPKKTAVAPAEVKEEAPKKTTRKRASKKAE